MESLDKLQCSIKLACDALNECAELSMERSRKSFHMGYDHRLAKVRIYMMLYFEISGIDICNVDNIFYLKYIADKTSDCRISMKKTLDREFDRIINSHSHNREVFETTTIQKERIIYDEVQQQESQNIASQKSEIRILANEQLSKCESDLEFALRDQINAHRSRSRQFFNNTDIDRADKIRTISSFESDLLENRKKSFRKYKSQSESRITNLQSNNASLLFNLKSDHEQQVIAIYLTIYCNALLFLIYWVPLFALFLHRSLSFK